MQLEYKKSIQMVKNSGFSLLEMAIALTIISILSFSILSGVLITRDYDKYQENRLQLEEIRNAMKSFVQANGFLPCPDTDVIPNGVENRDGGVGSECTRDWGRLPYQAFGVKSDDVWGNDFYYAVNRNADNSGVINDATRPSSYFSTQLQQIGDFNGNNTWLIPRFNLATGLNPVSVAGNLVICGETVVVCNNATPAANLLEDRTAIAVVVSFGVNGRETWAGQALLNAEAENFDNDQYFWQARGSNDPIQFFDDQLMWFTGNDVKAAMLNTERGLR